MDVIYSDTQAKLWGVLTNPLTAPEKRLADAVRIGGQDVRLDYLSGRDDLLIEAPLIIARSCQTGPYTEQLMIAIAKNICEINAGLPLDTRCVVDGKLFSGTEEEKKTFRFPFSYIEKNIQNSYITGHLGYWSHAVCHHFEGSKIPDSVDKLHVHDGSSESLLNNPVLHEGAALLVAESVRRSINMNDKGCLDRILGGVIRYNLACALYTKAGNNFAFKPASLSDRRLVSTKADGETVVSLMLDSKQKAFLQAKTPADFLRTAVDGVIGLNISEDMLSRLAMRLPQAALDVQKVQKYSGCFSLQALFSKCNHDCKNFQKETGKTIIEKCFVDVDNTLVINGRLNTKIATLVSAMHEQNGVIVFTSGDPRERQAMLARFGLNVPVYSKADYADVILKNLIDDTSPSDQGLQAIYYDKPEAYDISEIWANTDKIYIYGSFVSTDFVRQEYQRLARLQRPELRL